MAEPFLSELKLDEHTPAVAVAGRWESQPFSILSKIAAATPGKFASFFSLARSVPSVWGYAYLFYEAWRDPHHELHEVVSEIWRRFLCLVALHELWARQGVVLRITSWNKLEEVRGFIGTAFEQLPHRLFEGDLPHFAGILYERQVIGLTLPGLLVLPSRSLIANVPDRLERCLAYQELFDNKEKLSYDRLWSPLILGSLEAYLAWAEDQLRQEHNKPAVRTELADALAYFSRRLRACRDPARTWPRRTWSDGSSDSPRQGGAGVVSRLVSPSRSVGGTSGVRDVGEIFATDCQLPLRPAFTDRHLKLVFFSDGLRDHEQLRTARVYGDRFVADLYEREISRDDRVKLLKNGILLVHPSDLLRRNLIRLKDGELEEQRAWKRYLLPVTPLALVCFSLDELLMRLRLVEEQDEQVRVALDLPLGGGDEITDYSELRTYARSSELYSLIEATRMTTLAFWPSYFAPELAFDIVYQNGVRGGRSSEGKAQIAARMPLSENKLLEAFKRLGSASFADPRAFRFDHLYANVSGHFFNASLSDRPDVLRTLMNASQPIEAIECEVDGHLGLLASNQRRPCLPVVDQMRCRAAIDFGTTNTTVAVRYGDVEEPARTGLAPHVWLPLDQGALSELRHDPAAMERFAGVRDVAFNFIPPLGEITTPFLTLLEVRAGLESAVPLARSRIPFVRGMGVREIAERIQRADDLRISHAFGLKWNSEGERRDYVCDFLFQVMLHVIVDARARGIHPETIEWRLTRPRTLPKDIQVRFSEEATQALSRALGGNSKDTPKIEFHWESRCVFHYLIRKQPQDLAHVVVTFDVGGRSTDISVQNGSKLLWDGSVTLAGQAILVDYWCQHWDKLVHLLDELEDTSTIIGSDLASIVSTFARKSHTGGAMQAEAQLKALVELVLNDTELARELWEQPRSPSDEGLIARTWERARLALLGLVYLTIHFVLAPLRQSGEINAEHNVTLFFGGRGSRIFHYLCCKPGSDELVDQGLVNRWLTGVGFACDERAVSFSLHPKFEVALGALDAPVEDGEKNSAGPGLELAQVAPPNHHDFEQHQPGLSDFCKQVASQFETLPALADAPRKRAVQGYLLQGELQNAFSAGDSATAKIEQVRREFVLGLMAILKLYDQFRAES